MNDDIRQFLIEGERAGVGYSLAIPKTTAALTTGLHLGRQAGSSLEFRDHRDYQPGDDLRRIDWNAYARSDKLVVKLHREEISPHLDIVIDGSRSMGIASGIKAGASIGLAALFAIAAQNAGYTHNAWMLSDRCKPIVNGKSRPSIWIGVDFEFRGNPAESFSVAPPAFRRQGTRVLISDLLWMGEPLNFLRQFSRGASSVIVAQALAEVDINPPERGRIRLIDSETDESREIFVDDSSIKRYRDALARHQQNWQSACRRIGATMIELVAEKVVDGWNVEELVKTEVLRI